MTEETLQINRQKNEYKWGSRLMVAVISIASILAIIGAMVILGIGSVRSVFVGLFLAAYVFAFLLVAPSITNYLVSKFHALRDKSAPSRFINGILIGAAICLAPVFAIALSVDLSGVFTGLAPTEIVLFGAAIALVVGAVVGGVIGLYTTPKQNMRLGQRDAIELEPSAPTAASPLLPRASASQAPAPANSAVVVTDTQLMAQPKTSDDSPAVAPVGYGTTFSQSAPAQPADEEGSINRSGI